MRLPLSWMREYVDPGLPAARLAERLAMTGTEVDRIERHGVGAPDGFVVGRVLSAEQHPDADRLSVCMVDVGEGEPEQIVCGAPNVAAGQTVAVARPGALMPDGTRLGRAKLRGIVSSGMILAEDELAIGVEHDGIMVLADGAAPGAPLDGVLPIQDEVLELEVTPNRPDCLGVYGLAREIHAITGAALGPPPWADDPGSVEGAPVGIEVVVEAPELCPRFTGRVFEDVTIGPSPAWLKARLMASGQRPINNVVDITNYAMLLTGHPLHAFDLDRIAGGRLVVRRAAPGEVVRTLDGQDRVLDRDDCLIADGDGPTSIAGVMGGERSEVHEGTTRVLMEVATWDGPSINRTSWKLGLRSEASARFEKGLPPEGCVEAQAIATRLMLELAGARVVPGTLDVGSAGEPAPSLRLRDARVSGLLGAEIPRTRCAELLRALGFESREVDEGLEVAVPHWRRRDVTREADLIEEVARIDALEALPATIQRNRTGHAGGLSPAQRLRRRAEDALVGRGLLEVVGWSFTDLGLPDRLLAPDGDPLRDLVVLENPMSAEQAALRPTIVGSLLDVARRNRAHGQGDLAIFESGAVYRRGTGELADEHHALGALLVGATRPPSWRDGAPPPADAFAAKALVEAVLGSLGVPWSARQARRPFLHPGRCGEVVGPVGKTLGVFGEIDPRVAAGWEIDDVAAFMAIDLGRAIAAAPASVRYADLTTYPELRQDLAVIVGEDVPAGAVVDAVLRAGGPLVADATVFDVYRGEQAGAGRVSLALHLSFRAADRTLADADVAPLRERIVTALRDELGGELRG
ncbi:MAG: phenylalanine--tRNA ligase subunit beta [Solirubrobacteraceae bacterium]|nr:phenylalanine--tRNA ligase subunit beta [Solirubrobacteraceae bacterium]